MASIVFPLISKSIRLPSGVTYSYAYVEPKGNKPYILFLHGFPDASFGWRHQVPYFSELGYGLIVPDLLGYGGTDKPKEVDAYKLKKISTEVVGILDAHNIETVIGVGHDWGSNLLSRFVNYFPQRFSKLAFVDVGYRPPMGPFSVDEINKMTEQNLGYPVFGYWHFFNDGDAGKLMDENTKSVNSLLYPADPTFVKDKMCYIGATRKYFKEGQTGPIAPWVSPEEIATHEKIFGPSNGGYGPCLNWYKAQIANLNTPDEDGIEEAKHHPQQHALLVTCSKDYIAVPSMQEMAMKPCVKNLTIKHIDSGHWVQAEKSEELNMILQAFIG